jgi:H+/Cl- antiporter ClcA
VSHRALHRLLRLFWTTLAVGVAGLAALVVAIGMASVRYAHCGPSTLDAAQAACRTATQVLAAAYLLLSVALVLGAACLTLLWRLRRERHRRH